MHSYACLLSANFFSKAVMVRYDIVSTSDPSTTGSEPEQEIIGRRAVPTHLEREDRTHRQAPHRIGIPHLGVLLLDLVPSDTQVRRVRLALVHESSSVVDDGLEPASLEVEVLDLLL